MSFLDYGWFFLLVPTTMLLPASPPLVLSAIKLSTAAEDHARNLPFQADKHIAAAVERIKGISQGDATINVTIALETAATKIQAIFRGNAARKTETTSTPV